MSETSLVKQNSLASLTSFVNSQLFTKIITTLIIFNAIILGLETYPHIMLTYGSILKTLDQVILWIFVAELFLRFFVYGRSLFHDPWTLFDVIVVSIAFIPAQEIFSVLRAARVLRVLRLVSIFPKLRRVIEGLIQAIPGIGSIGGILAIIMYVFSVMATRLYGASYPEWFGSLHTSFFSLFQIMTLEGWPDIVRTIMKTNPYSWMFFVIYILIATFSVLNLFIAVIVDAMQKQHESIDHDANASLERIESLLTKLNQKIDNLKINT